MFGTQVHAPTFVPIRSAEDVEWILVLVEHLHGLLTPPHANGQVFAIDATAARLASSMCVSAIERSRPTGHREINR